MSIKQRKRAFTLVELLVVLFIAVVLLAILLPVVGSVRDEAAAAKAINNVRQIGIANQLYIQDHHGRILGPGNFTLPDGSFRGVSWRIAPYVGADDSALTWDRVVTVIKPLRDPKVPPELCWGPDSYQFAHCFNILFDMDDWNGWRPNAGRKFNEFNNPAKLLYAMSGIWMFNAENVRSDSQLPMPEMVREGPYFSHSGKTPAVYLDGHTEMLPFPIDPELVDPPE